MAFRSHLPEPTPSKDPSAVVPPPVVVLPTGTDVPIPPSDAAKGSAAELPEIQATPGQGSKTEAAGWMTSLLLHIVILVVVWLLVAPANLGGVNAIVISMSWSDEPEEAVTQILSVKAVEPAAESVVPKPAELPDLSDVAIEDLAGGGGGDGSADLASSATGTGSSAGGKSSPRGTFFGIEAYGHDFVYVVDMSGSMEGHLYACAIAELIRSIDHLNPTQKFYVTLFSDGAKAMFDDKSAIPQTVPATPENRERLAKWLTEAYDGGGTDPRQSVKLALDMKPSAVFMLSDGEFKERRRKDAGFLMAGDSSTTAAIVRTTDTTIPIHSIAFENQASRKNMQELANLTNGTFRFVAAEDQSKQISKSLADISKATKLSQHYVAQVFWNEIIHTIILAKVDSELREEVIDLALSRGQRAYDEGHLPGVMIALQSLVAMDPEAEFTLEQQTQLLEHSQQLQGTHDDRVDLASITDAMLVQSELIQRFPGSEISKILGRSLTKQLNEQADRLAKSDDIPGLFRLYDQVRSLNIRTVDRAETLQHQRKIVQDQIAIAQQKEENEGTLAFVVHLVDLFEGSGNSWLDLGGREALQQASMRMHAQLRDASGNQSLNDRTQLKREIKIAGQRSPDFARAAVDFTRNDRKARGIMNQARRNEQQGRATVAINQYKTIVNQYPYSRSIDFARERLAALTGTTLEPRGDQRKTAEADSSFLDEFNEMFSAKPATSDQDRAQPSESEPAPPNKPAPTKETGGLQWLLDISESQ